jgi:hypothetical protein
MSDDKQNQVREPQLLHSAAVSRRVDALFRAMSTDSCYESSLSPIQRRSWRNT